MSPRSTSVCMYLQFGYSSFWFCSFFCFVLETRSLCPTLAVLELTLEARLASNLRCSQGWATTPNSKISAAQTVAWSQEPLETLGASGDSVPASTEVGVAGPGWGGRDRAGWVWLLGATWWHCAAEAADPETRGSLCNSDLPVVRSYLMLGTQS